MEKRRVGLYLRVSTTDQGQTIDNQELALREAIGLRLDWEIVDRFVDNGISGRKGRDQRAGFDCLMKAVSRRKIDIVAAWSVDRLGRSLKDLVDFLGELRTYHCDLYLEKQAVDTTTPAGRALFQMLGVFAEFEAAIIQERIHAGIARAKAQGTKSGKPIGRPRLTRRMEEIVRAELANGTGILKTARQLRLGVSTVQRIKREMEKVA
jgi:DNA invertase Pin-like site-specific DNA recombinase